MPSCTPVPVDAEAVGAEPGTSRPNPALGELTPGSDREDVRYRLSRSSSAIRGHHSVRDCQCVRDEVGMVLDLLTPGSLILTGFVGFVGAPTRTNYLTILVTATGSAPSTSGDTQGARPQIIGDWSRHDFYVHLHADWAGLIGLHGCDPAPNGASDIESRVQVTNQGSGLKLTITVTYVISGKAPIQPVPAEYWSKDARGTGQGRRLRRADHKPDQGLVNIQSFYSNGQAVAQEDVLCSSDSPGQEQASTGICGAARPRDAGPRGPTRPIARLRRATCSDSRPPGHRSRCARSSPRPRPESRKDHPSDTPDPYVPDQRPRPRSARSR
jgi:hypothetical protein